MSAPSAASVSISTAVWIVMCSEPAMRAPFSGCLGPYSLRVAMRPGISNSASSISARPKSVEDPTGCGDAYRAGLLYGLLNDLDWETTGRIASLMGSIKIEHQGPQNHKFTLEQFKKRYKAAFGLKLN